MTQLKVSGVPKPGLPPEYPEYLKPIPINNRSVLALLRSYTDEREPEIARWLYSTWTAEAEALKYQEIRNAIADGEVPQRVIDEWRQDYSRFITDVMVPEWTAAATLAGERLAGQINKAVPKVGELFQFSVTGRRIADWIEGHGGELAVNLTQSQHRALRAVIKQYTVVEPLPVDEVAIRIRPIIGLTEREALAVSAYRAELAKEGTLSAIKIEKKVQDYAAWLHRRRATRIAITETAVAFKQGQRESMIQAREKGWFGGRLLKTWLVADDERLCPECSAMDGETVLFDQPYSNGLMTPQLHPLCRCAEKYSVEAKQ